MGTCSVLVGSGGCTTVAVAGSGGCIAVTVAGSAGAAAAGGEVLTGVGVGAGVGAGAGDPSAVGNTTPGAVDKGDCQMIEV